MGESVVGNHRGLLGIRNLFAVRARSPFVAWVLRGVRLSENSDLVDPGVRVHDRGVLHGLKAVCLVHVLFHGRVKKWNWRKVCKVARQHSTNGSSSASYPPQLVQNSRHQEIVVSGLQAEDLQ